MTRFNFNQFSLWEGPPPYTRKLRVAGAVVRLGGFLEDQFPSDLQVEALMTLGRIVVMSNLNIIKYKNG
ncbi:hypothetical protein P8452_16378 [Trifolium repens]|nr:hypothetical protein P8452_16378 [Trifolium repens]